MRKIIVEDVLQINLGKEESIQK